MYIFAWATTIYIYIHYAQRTLNAEQQVENTMYNNNMQEMYISSTII